MNFLSKFRPAKEPVPEVEEDLFVRRRTFSAAQYREEELARHASERAERESIDNAAAEAAAAVRAQRVADAESERAEMADDEESAGGVAPEPMDWEEAVGWLSTKSADARSYVAQVWNWEQDLRVLHFLVTQPDMDKGVATGIFWLTGATEDFFPWGDDTSPADEQFRRAMEMVDALGRRFAAEDFAEGKFGFDDSWDCSQLKERLEELYMDGRIEWSPGPLSTVSPGPQPTIDDVPREERAEIKDFLRRHGCI